MRRAAPLCALLCAACAEWRMRPLTAPYQASAPVLQEQALVGLDEDGDAAALQLVEAEGMPASLTLWRLDRDGGPSRLLLSAPPEIANAVATSVRERGRTEAPLLLEAATRPWSEAFVRAHVLGFESLVPDAPGNGAQRYPVTLPGGAGSASDGPQAGAYGDVACFLRVAHLDGDPPAFVLLLGEDGSDEVEIARQPTAGAPVDGGVVVRGATAWLLSGSVGAGDPLRRTIALRRGSIAHGIAHIHFSRGRAERAKGNLDNARLQFARAVAADPRFVDAIYAAAAVEAVSGREEAAVSLLRRAAGVDRRRVQVLGRDDEDLVSLRNRPDVRKLLGLPRLPAG